MNVVQRVDLLNLSVDETRQETCNFVLQISTGKIRAYLVACNMSGNIMYQKMYSICIIEFYCIVRGSLVKLVTGPRGTAGLAGLHQ